jgi:hypothetical protein
MIENGKSVYRQYKNLSSVIWYKKKVRDTHMNKYQKITYKYY